MLLAKQPASSPGFLLDGLGAVSALCVELWRHGHYKTTAHGIVPVAQEQRRPPCRSVPHLDPSHPRTRTRPSWRRAVRYAGGPARGCTYSSIVIYTLLPPCAAAPFSGTRRRAWLAGPTANRTYMGGTPSLRPRRLDYAPPSRNRTVDDGGMLPRGVCAGNSTRGQSAGSTFERPPALLTEEF